MENETKRQTGEVPLPLVAAKPASSEANGEMRSTFASIDAPWVGAEDAWLSGVDRHRVAPALQQPTQPTSEEPAFGPDSFPSSVLEEHTFVPTSLSASVLPPMTPSGSGRAVQVSDRLRRAGLAIALTATVGFILTVTVIVLFTRGESTTKSHLLESQRASQEARIEALQKQVEQLKSQTVRNDITVVSRQQPATEQTRPSGSPEIAPESRSSAENEDRNRRHRQGNANRAAAISLSLRDLSTLLENQDSADKTPEETSEPVMEDAKGESVAVEPEAATQEDTTTRKPTNELDDLLGPPSENGTAVQAEPAPDDAADLTTHAPSPRDIHTALSAIRPLISQCGAPPSPSVSVTIAIQGATGRVIGARASESTHEGTPFALCLSRAIQVAKFPPFARDRAVVSTTIEL